MIRQRLQTAIKQAREYGVLGKNIFESNFDFDLANSDLAGEVVGCIKSESGKPIVGAVVVIHNGWFFVDAASNKKGEYKARPMFGEYVVEVSMPGYEKYVGEVYGVVE